MSTLCLLCKWNESNKVSQDVQWPRCGAVGAQGDAMDISDP